MSLLFKRLTLFGCVAFALVLSGGTQSQAALLISLSSSPSDLTSVQAGVPVRVDVNLSGLAAGEELTLLSTRLTFDGALLGTPLISPGSILPDPLDDPLDFIAVSEVGAGDATFLTFGIATSSHITTNGVFCSFDVVVQGLGMSEFALTFADALQVDPEDPQNLISPPITLGDPLPINAVPEPSALALMCLGVCTLAAARRRIGFLPGRHIRR